MKYIEAPDAWFPDPDEGPGVFLAGGITDCPNWQEQMMFHLSETDFALLNPRRENFPMDDPAAANEQILWEHVHLRRADRILFWFPAATLCPIVLYELGAWSMTSKHIAIGIEPGYQREQDVRIQTQLIRPDVPIVSTLFDLAAAIQ